MGSPIFAFTKLVTDDLDTVERFYCGVFGMKRVHAVSADEHQYALDEVILSSGGHSLIITRYRHRPCPPAGAAWTGFVVADIGAALIAVEQGGGRIEVPAHDNPEHGVRAAIAADPAGHLIEIIQMTSGVKSNP